MNGSDIAQIAVLGLSVILSAASLWIGRGTQRLHALTTATHELARANWNLATAHYRQTGVEQAKAEVAAAEEAVRQAETRLPRRLRERYRKKDA